MGLFGNRGNAIMIFSIDNCKYLHIYTKYITRFRLGSQGPGIVLSEYESRLKYGEMPGWATRKYERADAEGIDRT